MQHSKTYISQTDSQNTMDNTSWRSTHKFTIHEIVKYKFHANFELKDTSEIRKRNRSRNWWDKGKKILGECQGSGSRANCICCHHEMESSPLQKLWWITESETKLDRVEKLQWSTAAKAVRILHSAHCSLFSFPDLYFYNFWHLFYIILPVEGCRNLKEMYSRTEVNEICYCSEGVRQCDVA